MNKDNTEFLINVKLSSEVALLPVSTQHKIVGFAYERISNAMRSSSKLIGLLNVRTEVIYNKENYGR